MRFCPTIATPLSPRSETIQLRTESAGLLILAFAAGILCICAMTARVFALEPTGAEAHSFHSDLFI